MALDMGFAIRANKAVRLLSECNDNKRAPLVVA